MTVPEPQWFSRHFANKGEFPSLALFLARGLQQVQEDFVGDQAVFFGRESDAVTRMLTQPATVLETGVYRGPHYYSHTPMIRIQIDLGRLEDRPPEPPRA